MKELIIDLRTAFISPPVLFRKARVKGVHEIDQADIIDRDAVRLAEKVIITDGFARRVLKSRDQFAN